MTEAEAKAAAKTLRSALIGVTAAPVQNDRWGVKRWTESAVYPNVDVMPADWRRELERS